MAADSGIDPRYAAQFQRGFDPARHAVAPPPEQRGPAPVAAPAPPVVRLVPSHPPLTERPAPAVEPERAVPPEDDPQAGVELRWQWALPALAVVLLVAAVLMFWTSATDTRMYTGSWTQEDYLLASARAGLPGPLFVAGILVLSVWLVARGLTRRDPR